LGVEDVYVRFTTYLIKKHNNLDILGYTFLEKNFDVPNWVPDWTVRHIPHPFPKRKWTAEHSYIYSAAYRACGARTADARFQNDGRPLIVEGIILDTILDVSEPRCPDSISDPEKVLIPCQGIDPFCL
jgi:hypothetical protein